MTDTDVISAPKSKARAGLSGMVLTELRALAGELGIKGTSGMRKGDLIAAIKERQGGADQLTLTPTCPKRYGHGQSRQDQGAPHDSCAACGQGYRRGYRQRA